MLELKTGRLGPVMLGSECEQAVDLSMSTAVVNMLFVHCSYVFRVLEFKGVL